MGQVSSPSSASTILSPIDRFVATNAAGGMNPSAAHVIALGENAGLNMGAVTGVIVLGAESGKTLPATANNTIVIGENSGTGLASPGNIVIGAGSMNGPMPTVAMDDFIVIGNRSFAALTTQAFTTYPAIAIGSDIAPVKTSGTNFSGFIAIGAEILLTDNAAAGSTLEHTLMIGHGIRRNGTQLGTTSLGQSVFIGNNILRDNYSGSPNNNSVFVGYGVMRITAGGGFQANESVLVGANIDTSNSGTAAIGDYSVLIGASTTYPNTASANRAFCVSVGYGNLILGTQNIQVGDQNATSRGTRNVFLGSQNDFGADQFNDTYLLGYGHTSGNSGGALLSGSIVALAPTSTKWVLWGSGATGNVVLGNSTAADKDLLLAGTNRLKLINGTVALSAPVNGGYFYLTAGQLRYVDSNGVDSVLSYAIIGAVATLPALGLLPGQRAFVTDALAPAFATAAVGGGAVGCPVYWDGAAWLCG